MFWSITLYCITRICWSLYFAFRVTRESGITVHQWQPQPAQSALWAGPLL